LRFYVQRDTDPQLWYPAANNGVSKFDDLPAARRGNVDVTDLPLNLARGAQPIWNDADIDDVVAFLKTLSDRDTANQNPAATRRAVPAAMARH
jgi:cytochrome c peroxidase